MLFLFIIISILQLGEADKVTLGSTHMGMENVCLKSSSGRTKVENGAFSRDSRILDVDMVDQKKTQYLPEMLQEMEPEISETNSCIFSDVKEAFGGMGFRVKKPKDKIDRKAMEKLNVQSSQGPDEKNCLLPLEGNTAVQGGVLLTKLCLHFCLYFPNETLFFLEWCMVFQSNSFIIAFSKMTHFYINHW